jgi:hypothetical protein
MGVMSNMNSHRIEIYGCVVEISADRVFANAIVNIFQPIEKKWHDKVIEDFYSTFDDLDDLYENADDLADDVLEDVVDAALDVLAKNSIYDIDAENFIKNYLNEYEFWDDEFEIIASQYEAIIDATARKDAHRTQRRLNRSKLVGFGAGPSLENGYRSAQSYADFSNAVDNIGHGIFNLMAKGVTAIGDSIKKEEIFKDEATLDALDSAVCSIIQAGRDALIDVLSERCGGAIHNYSDQEIMKANAILTNVESGRVPEADVQKQIVSLFAIYPYDDRIYKNLLARYGADDGRLDAAADFFGVCILLNEKEQIFRARLKDANLTTVDNIRSNVASFSELGKKLGYLNYKSDLRALLESVREKEFQNEVSKYDLQSSFDFDKNLPLLENFARKIGYGRFAEWSADVRVELDKKQRTIQGVEYCSQYNADYAEMHLKKMQGKEGQRISLSIQEFKFNKNHLILVAKNVVEGSGGMKLSRMDEVSGVIEGKTSVSLMSWGETFTINVGGEERENSAVLVIQSISKSSFAGTNKNTELVNKIAEEIRINLESSFVS